MIEEEVGETPEDGGFIPVDPVEERWDEARHKAETAKSLAVWLVCVFAGSLVLHYVAVGILTHYGKEAPLETLSDAFNAWLPVLSSLLSAAATYYFTRERE